MTFMAIDELTLAVVVVRSSPTTRGLRKVAGSTTTRVGLISTLTPPELVMPWPATYEDLVSARGA